MSLSGNLRTMALADVLQWIASDKKTGTLHLERLQVRKRIVFRRGTITTSWSNDPRESLGQYLVRDLRITEEQLFKALLRQEGERSLLGSILVSEGIISEEELRSALRSKAEETIYDVFLWPDGKFEFRAGEYPENIHFHIEASVTEVLLEGVRREDEWPRMRAVFPSSRTTLKLRGAPLDVHSPVERQLLGLCAAGKSLGEICLQMRRSEFETASILYDLHERGAIEVDFRGEIEDPGQHVGTIQDLLQQAEQQMQAGELDAAMGAYEQVLGLDRLNQEAKKGVIAVVQARRRRRIAQGVPLSGVPALRMDLAALTHEKFDPQEGFVLSRVNGQWDVRSILKVCPMGEEDTLLIFARLLEKKVIALREPAT